MPITYLDESPNAESKITYLDSSVQNGKQSFSDMAWDALGRFGKGAYEATKPVGDVLSAFSPLGMLNKGLGGAEPNQIYGNIAPSQNVGQQVAEGLGNAAGIIPMAMPFMEGAGTIPLLGRSAILRGALGFGAMEGTKKLAEGKPQEALPAAAEGAKSGALYGVGGRIGTEVASRMAPAVSSIFNPVISQTINKFSPNIGTAAGQAIVGGMSAPEGHKISSSIIGGGLGLVSPTRPINQMTQAEYNNLINKNADVYRQVLSPGKGEIFDVEIKSGKNLDDYYKLAAQEGLVIHKSEDGKLDTTEARKSLSQKEMELNDKLTKSLASNPNPQFDLKGIGWLAKNNLRNKIKNDAEFNTASKEIDNYIDAAVDARGQQLNGSDLNNFKQGMWQTSYDPLKPNSKIAARAIGFAAKDAIEKSYPNEGIQEVNNKLGQYLTLDTLLEKAQGRVIQKGKMGRYVAQIIGGATGSHIPLVGPLAGGYLGGKVNDYMNNPERITQKLSNKAKGLNVIPSVVGATAVGIGSMFNPINAQAAQEKTIGQKNNNPINLKAFDKWDGMTGKDRFGHAQFKSLDHGIRAAYKNLSNHKRDNPAQPLEGYLKTFAEANHQEEAEFIAKNLGISPKASLASIDMGKLIIPMAQFESKIKLTPKDIQRVKERFNLK